MARVRVHPLGQQLFRVGLTHRLGCITDDVDRAMRQIFSTFIELFKNARAFRGLAQFRNSLRPDMCQAVDRHRLQVAAL